MQQLQRLLRQILGQEAELLGVLVTRGPGGVLVTRLPSSFASVRFFRLRAFGFFGGVPFVGAFPSYGYIKNPEDNHKLIIDKESAEIVRKIFEWKVNEGLGNLSICHRLNDMGVLNPTGYKKKKLNQNYNNSQIMQEDYRILKLQFLLRIQSIHYLLTG